MSDTPSVPAGWYADAEVPGGLRWWDGAAWTEHRQPPPTPPEIPVPQSTIPAFSPGYEPVVLPAYEPVGASGYAGEPPLWAPWYGISFGKAFVRVFKKYARFDGRASLSEYWWWVLANGLVVAVLYVIFLVLALSTGYFGSNGRFELSGGAIFGIVLLSVWGIGVFIPSLAVIVRRLHDANYSGWFYLLAFVPFGSIIILIFTVMPSNPVGARFDQQR